MAALTGAVSSAPLQRFVGPIAAAVGELERLDRIERRRLGRGARQADVHGDAVQPGAERRVALEAGQAAIGADEGVLREVAGVGVIAGEAIAHAVDGALVPADEDVEGGPIARRRRPRPARDRRGSRRSTARGVRRRDRRAGGGVLPLATGHRQGRRPRHASLPYVHAVVLTPGRATVRPSRRSAFLSGVGPCLWREG